MLVDQYQRWLACARADNVPMLEYACPDCGAELFALKPPNDEDCWDSLVCCTYCQNVHYREAHHRGVVEAWRLSQ